MTTLADTVRRGVLGRQPLPYAGRDSVQNERALREFRAGGRRGVRLGNRRA
nr:hypothetical protein [Streptomyces sp. S4.7]